DFANRQIPILTPLSTLQRITPRQRGHAASDAPTLAGANGSTVTRASRLEICLERPRRDFPSAVIAENAREADAEPLHFADQDCIRLLRARPALGFDEEIGLVPIVCENPVSPEQLVGPPMPVLQADEDPCRRRREPARCIG